MCTHALCVACMSHLHMHARVCDFAAGTNVAEGDGEAGGVGDMTKQLEQQTLEEKEKEVDGEEGSFSTPSSSSAAGIVLNL